MTESAAAATLLTVNDLVVEYPGAGFRAKPFRALTDINISIAPGETLGLVGESGSGKTTLGRAVLGLAPVTEGTITFEGDDISHASRRERQRLSRHLQVVFQDPYTSLNPAMQIGDILAEPLGIQGVGQKQSRLRVKELLDQVGLPGDAIGRLPREASGSGSPSPAPWLYRPNSSSATSRSAPWTSPPRRGYSTYSCRSSRTPASPTCSCRTTSTSCGTSAIEWP
jgi:ABC-type glutathione transport system ATPase component